jgi:hypothetical protein
MEINPSEYDIPSLINDTVQLNIMQIGSKPIEFILDINENLPSRLIGDELRIKQILNNLISNAVKYTDTGHVKLNINHLKQGEDVILCFVIEDTGQGMKKEDCEKLFSEYLRFNMRANRDREGTGLGLSISRINLTGLEPICIILSCTVSFIRLGISYSDGFISIFPVSIFDKSKMSFIIPKRLFPELYIFCIAICCLADRSSS